MLPLRHDRAVADYGQPARLSDISKMVLSIVKFGGAGGTRKQIRNSPIVACVPTILTTMWDVRSLPPEVDSQSMLSHLQL